MDPQTPVTPNPLSGPDPVQPQPCQSFQPDVVTPGTPVPAEEVTSDLDLPIQPASEAPGTMMQPEPEFPSPMPEAMPPAPVMPAQPAVPDMQPQSAQSYVPNVDVTVKPAEPVQPASMPAFMNPNPGDQNQPGGLAQPGMRGDQPPVMVNVVNKKSKLPLIIAIVLVLILIGGGAAYALTRKKSPASSGAKSSSNASSNSDTAKKPEDNTAKVSTVAKYTSDFDEVCKGGAISNAADYTTNKAAIIESFHSSVITKDSWTFDSVGYGKSYYLTNVDDFAKISVVACAKYVDDSAKTGKACEYESSGTKVTIDYQSTEYDLTYYEAKTGKKISDGGKINGPATTCPSSVLYDQSTKKAYADPDDNALEAAFDTFVK